jgi:putative transposase
VPEVYLTTQFKIHNPSRRKRAIMDRALKAYTMAYARLLEMARAREDEMRQACVYRGRVSAMSLAAYLARLFAEHKAFHPLHSSMWDSLFQDAAGNIAGYFELQEKAKDDESAGPPSWPQAPDLETGPEILLYRYREALDALATCADLDEENALRAAVTRRTDPPEPLPVSFVRADAATYNRNFGLFYEPETRGLWAMLYLLPGNDPRKRPLQGRPRRLIAIHKSGEEFRPPGNRPVPYLLVPLEYGEWQWEKFIEPALKDPGRVRTAKLYRKGDDYYLNVTFAFPAPQPVKPQAVLAVARSSRSLVEIAVADLAGTLLRVEDYPGDEWWEEQKRQREVLRRIQARGDNRRLYFRRINDNIIHLLSNRLVALAKEHQAQVVFLRDRRPPGGVQPAGKRERVNFILSRHPYGKLRGQLEYKLPLAGLPKPKEVYPWKGMLRACPECGHEVQAAGEICICGRTVEPGRGLAAKIARRWLDIRRNGK